MKRHLITAAFALVALASTSGCDTLFFPSSGGRGGALSGTGPDGGVCTKDPQTIKNVMLAPPTCNATNPCPCGTFCSSQTGGNCVADCVDDTWCAPGYTCSGFGQCVAAGSGTDGGADASAPTVDPSCPRNSALLDSLQTMPRACQFDDICPFGSYCNHAKETCDTDCRADSQCASMNTPGHTFVCGCLGKCAEVAAPRVPPAVAQPTLEVSPSQFTLSRPTTITTPNWGDMNLRKVSLVVVTTFVNTATPSGTGGSGGTGGAGGAAMVITGPTAAIVANPGPGLMVQCPGGSGGAGGSGGTGGGGSGGTLSAMPCTIVLDPTTFVKSGDVYRSRPIVLTVAPSTGAPTATSWSLRLDSKDLSNVPKVVKLAYADTVVTNPSTSFPPVTTLDGNFTGTGEVQIITPTNQSLRIAVKARVWDGNLTFFDETRQLSPSGKLVMMIPTTPLNWQAYIDTTADSDPALQDTFTGGVIQRINSFSINQDPVTGNVSGSFTKTTFTDFVFAQPLTGTLTSPFDQPLSGSFTITKTPASAVGSCVSDSDCTGGAHCDLAFCSFGPGYHPDPSNTSAPRGAAFQMTHKRMRTWGPYFGDDTSGNGFKGIYLPASYWLGIANDFLLIPQVGAISAEPHAQLIPSSLPQNVAPVDVPLVTQRETNWPTPASYLLHYCMQELAHDRTMPVANPDTETYDSGANCINLGRTAVALNDRSTFQRTLQKWLDVHAFVMREGLEEAKLNDVTSAEELATDPAPVFPPPTLEQLLTTGESGLGFLLDVNANHDGTAFVGLSPSEIWARSDYRRANFQFVCATDTDCNPQGGHTSACASGFCTILNMSQMPQQEQPVGVPPIMFDTATAYLRVLEGYLNRVARQTYGQPADTNPTSARQAALARYGMGMRLVLAIEQLAVAINTKAGPCPTTTTSSITWDGSNCQAIGQRYVAARDEMNVARRRVIAQGEAVRLGANPFAIPEDDIPLFFGDPTGTNSRYFAASDYLIDGWAAPAVAQAGATLDAARSEWIAKMQAIAQDENAQHNRQQEIDQLMSKYGAPILAACGNLKVPDGAGGMRLLQTNEVIPYVSDGVHTLDPVSCFLDPTCVGQNGLDGREANNLLIEKSFWDATNNNFIQVPALFGTQPLGDVTVRSEVCKATYMQYTANDPFQLELKTLCPADVFGSTSGAQHCTVVRDPIDHHLYFGSMGTGTASPNIRMPLAFLYGPIRAVDVGSYYADAPSVGSRSVINWGTGPSDDVYSYHDYRTDQHIIYSSNRTVSDLFSTDAAAKCGDGTNGRLPQDYPLPAREMLPVHCYQGDLGVSFYDMHTNDLRMLRAKEVLDSGKKNLDDQFALCKKIDTDAATLLNKTDDYNQLKHDYDTVSTFVNFASQGLESAMSSGPPGIGAVTGILSLGMSLLGISVEDEAARLQRMEKQFSLEEKQQECWNTFRAQRRAMATAMTDIQIAASEINTQIERFGNLQGNVKLNVQEGISVLQRENGSPVASLSHQFWIDEKVERFKSELEWARRLVFTAMRAVEYEFQQSLPFRSDIVAAATPSQLAEVVQGLKQEQAARTINRRRPDDSSIVLSLRDDVLAIADRSGDPAGERAWTPAQRFASRLADASFAFRDRQGNYLGQGIPFTLGPTGVLETRCGERIWRATATLQGDGIDGDAPEVSVLLLKRNSFASQWCAGKAPTIVMPDGSASTPDMQTGVIHTSAQLFEPGSNIDLTDANEFTAALLTPWFNVRRTDFDKESYQDGSSEELAGRGLYGDYVMLFPTQLLDGDFAIDRVEDVLIRLDYLSVDNLSQ